MLYFAEQYPSKYAQIVLPNSCENLNNACLFVPSSIEVVGLLCKIFCLGKEDYETANYQDSVFMKMSFDSKEILEVIILLLYNYVMSTNVNLYEVASKYLNCNFTNISGFVLHLH
jgi:hypothetical protein